MPAFLASRGLTQRLRGGSLQPPIGKNGASKDSPSRICPSRECSMYLDTFDLTHSGQIDTLDGRSGMAATLGFILGWLLVGCGTSFWTELHYGAFFGVPALACKCKGSLLNKNAEVWIVGCPFGSFIPQK